MPPLPSDHFPFVVTVGGPLPELITRDIEEIVVSTSLHMPAMVTIRLKDKDVAGAMVATALQYNDNPMFMLGTPISVLAVPAEKDTLPVPDVPQPIFTGELTALEAEFENGAAHMIIRGYDRSHRLNRGRKTKTFTFMPDNLIVTQVTAAAGVLGTVMPTDSPPRDYVIQNNQTDMEFVRDIARRNGYMLMVDTLGVLHFQPFGVPLPGTPATLIFGKNLTAFRPRLTAANQAASVLVTGWDPRLKMPVQGLFTPMAPPQLPPAALPILGTSRAVFGVAKEYITDVPVANSAEAIALAESRSMEISSQFLQAEGECHGNPAVSAGKVVMIAGVGTRYSGPYLVTSATHIYRAKGVYRTQFSISGTMPDTLSGLLASENGTGSSSGGLQHGRFNGVVIGVVTNNNDLEGLGRVKVRFPSLGMLPPIESDWCRIAAPMAGPMAGWYAIPEINDEVLVAFEHGDPAYPYVVGGLWNSMDRPPKPSQAVVVGGKVTKRILRSRSGHEITLDDTIGKESISIVDKAMTQKIIIDSTKKSIAISALGDVTIECLNFKVDAKAKIDLISKAPLTLDSKALIGLKSGAMLKLEATTASIKAKTGFTMDAKAILIKSSTILGLDGKPVNINQGALEVI